MATKKTKANAAGRKRTVAAGKLAGRPASETAKAAGITLRSVRRLQNDPEVKFIITEALKPQQERLRHLGALVVGAIEGALHATKEDEADHVARLRAVERYADVIALAQGKVVEEQAEGEHPSF